MNTTYNPPRITRHPALDGAAPHAAPAPGHHSDLVIENLAELAAAGVPGVCGACIADYFVRESPATMA
jgi:hypothetical protein